MVFRVWIWRFSGIGFYWFSRIWNVACFGSDIWFCRSWISFVADTKMGNGTAFEESFRRRIDSARRRAVLPDERKFGRRKDGGLVPAKGRGSALLIGFDIGGHVYHRRDPDVLLVIFQEMQQLAMVRQAHIDAMAAADAVKTEDQEGMRPHGFLYHIDHLRACLAVDGDGVDIVGIDRAERLHFRDHPPRARKVLPQSKVVRGIVDGKFPAGEGEGAGRLAVDGMQHDIHDADLVIGSSDGIRMEIAVGRDPAATPRHRSVTGMGKRMITQLMAMAGDAPPFVQPLLQDGGDADQIESSLQSHRIQRRNSIVEVLVDGVVVGEHYGALFVIPGMVG